jgi:hypothetical protein
MCRTIFIERTKYKNKQVLHKNMRREIVAMFVTMSSENVP